MAFLQNQSKGQGSGYIEMGHQFFYADDTYRYKPFVWKSCLDNRHIIFWITMKK